MSRKSKSAVPVLRYRYDGPQRNIGFTFSPLYLNEAKSGGKPEEMLFIYDEDFVYIRPAVSRAFPFRDPVTGEELDALDPCWENPIPKGRWGAVLAELDQLGEQILSCGGSYSNSQTGQGISLSMRTVSKLQAICNRQKLFFSPGNG